MEPARIVHPLEPIYSDDSRVLVLGTFPSPKSREVGFYYGHPQNRFWRVLATLFDEPEPLGIERRTAFLHAHGIALWDVLASCTIVGASDASIANPVPNDLTRITRIAPITHVFTTGAKASALYQKFSADLLPNVPHSSLPSTSPANARMHFEHLVEAYQPLFSVLKEIDTQ